jgi:hypothetical protein
MYGLTSSLLNTSSSTVAFGYVRLPPDTFPYASGITSAEDEDATFSLELELLTALELELVAFLELDVEAFFELEVVVLLELEALTILELEPEAGSSLLLDAASVMFPSVVLKSSKIVISSPVASSVALDSIIPVPPL